jgi:hypothetical protein
MGRSMRKLLWVIGAAVCVLAAPAFATTGAFQAQGQIAGIVGSAAIPSQKIGSFVVPEAPDGAILMAQVVSSPGDNNSGGTTTGGCNPNTVSPAKPCKNK